MYFTQHKMCMYGAEGNKAQAATLESVMIGGAKRILGCSSRTCNEWNRGTLTVYTDVWVVGMTVVCMTVVCMTVVCMIVVCHSISMFCLDLLILVCVCSV